MQHACMHEFAFKSHVLITYIPGRIENTCGLPDASDLSGWHTAISGVLTAGTGVAGLAGNIISIIVLMQK